LQDVQQVAGTDARRLRNWHRWNVRTCAGPWNHVRAGFSGDSGAAKLLGLNPSTLRSRMKVLGLERLAG
jgi:hypothetical protein